MVVDIFGRSRKRRAQGEAITLTESGDLDAGAKRLTNLAMPAADDDAATKKFVEGKMNAPGLPLGSTGEFDMQSKRVTNLAEPVFGNDAVTKQYLEGRTPHLTQKGDYDMQSKRLTNVGLATESNDVLTKKYLEDKISFEKNYVSLGGKRLVSVSDPINSKDVITLHYLQKHALSFDSKSKTYDARDQKISKLATPEPGSSDAVPCSYLEQKTVILDDSKDCFDAKKKRITNVGRATAPGDAVSRDFLIRKALCLRDSSQPLKQSEPEYSGFTWDGHFLSLQYVGDPVDDTCAVNEKYLKSALKHLSLRLRHELADLSINLRRYIHGIKESKKEKSVLAAELNTVESSIDRNWRGVLEVSEPPKQKYSKDQLIATNIVPEFLDE